MILVVDDVAEERELLAEALRYHGYIALTAADGCEALTLLQKSPAPGLIVFDLVMPGMNGWVFHQELLKNPALRDIPAVAISGQVAPGGSECLSVAGTLSKPFEVSELIQLVERCLLGPDPK